MIILDASAGLEFLRGGSEAGMRIGRRLAPLPTAHVPELFHLEVLNSLRRLERKGLLRGAGLLRTLDALAALRAERWSHRQLEPAIWRRRHNLSAYDAAYVALAELLDLPLLTSDAGLAKAAKAEVAVEFVEPCGLTFS